MTVSRWILLTMRNVSDISGGSQNILCSITFKKKKSHAVYKTVEKCGRAGQIKDDNLTPRMRFACWVRNATLTHSEYVILIAFPRRQSLCERTGVLRHITLPVLLIRDLYEPRKYALGRNVECINM